MSRILIIEDDPIIQKVLHMLLVSLGHEAVLAENGKVGLAAFKREEFDLVITDCVMPEMEGIETIEALRKLAPAVKIIAMSGGGRVAAMDYLRIARNLGAAAVIEKPFTLEEFVNVLASVFGRQN
jgi:CheY-like chemotaxis protein